MPLAMPEWPSESPPLVIEWAARCSVGSMLSHPGQMSIPSLGAPVSGALAYALARSPQSTGRSRFSRDRMQAEHGDAISAAQAAPSSSDLPVICIPAGSPGLCASGGRIPTLSPVWFRTVYRALRGRQQITSLREYREEQV